MPAPASGFDMPPEGGLRVLCSNWHRFCMLTDLVVFAACGWDAALLVADHYGTILGHPRRVRKPWR